MINLIFFIVWCEPNYAVVPYIVEFYNTVSIFSLKKDEISKLFNLQLSNLIIVFVAPIAIYLFRDFARRVTVGIQYVMILLIIVGITSMYFHGTLSLMGQLTDELSILWV